MLFRSYYNKPTQEGLYRHFKAIAEAVDLPMILYNVPGRTVADMATATTLRLAEVPGIVASRTRPVTLHAAVSCFVSCGNLTSDSRSTVAMMILRWH